MSPQDAVDLCRHAVMTTLLLSAPVLIAGLVVGLLVGLLQAVTQVQEQTVAFVPKLFAMFLVLALSLRYFREGGFYQGEYYFLLLTSFLGCVMMPSSRDMLLLFIALELVSAPGFLMAAFRKGDVKSNEAGVKFFIIGVLSTAVMLFGMSLIYGITEGNLVAGMPLVPTRPGGRESVNIGDTYATEDAASW